jgi:hypothetical protein
MTNVAEWNFDRGDWLQVHQLPERAGGLQVFGAGSEHR